MFSRGPSGNHGRYISRNLRSKGSFRVEEWFRNHNGFLSAQAKKRNGIGISYTGTGP
jgi:hypothetical protein